MLAPFKKKKKKKTKKLFAEAHSVWPEILAGSNFCNFCVLFQRFAKISSRK